MTGMEMRLTLGWKEGALVPSPLPTGLPTGSCLRGSEASDGSSDPFQPGSHGFPTVARACARARASSIYLYGFGAITW